VPPAALIRALVSAHALRLSGLRALCEREAALLRTEHISTISMALRSAPICSFADSLFHALPGQAPRRGLVAVDFMCLSLPRTRRHGCAPINDTTVGLGALFALAVEHHPGQRPVQVLSLVDGAWHDGSEIAAGMLVPHGPTHLLDRGFYTLANLNLWLDEGVHFIVRAKAQHLKWRTLRVCGAPRSAGDVLIEHDVMAEIGGPHPSAATGAHACAWSSPGSKTGAISCLPPITSTGAPSDSCRPTADAGRSSASTTFSKRAWAWPTSTVSSSAAWRRCCGRRFWWSVCCCWEPPLARASLC
jgi:hypothetical protein